MTTKQNPELWNALAIPERVSRRALARVEKLDDGCWISLYSVGSHGYAQIGWWAEGRSHMVLAHRAAWVRDHGQVPLGMTLDHVCKVRRCVNPAHLRLLPNFENARRTNGLDWPMGMCANGHANTALVRVRGRGLGCAECYGMYDARYRWRRRHPGEPFPERLLLTTEKVSA